MEGGGGGGIIKGRRMTEERRMRTKDLHLYILGMSQLCYYYTNPHKKDIFDKYVI